MGNEIAASVGRSGIGRVCILVLTLDRPEFIVIERPFVCLCAYE